MPFICPNCEREIHVTSGICPYCPQPPAPKCEVAKTTAPEREPPMATTRASSSGQRFVNLLLWAVILLVPGMLIFSAVFNSNYWAGTLLSWPATIWGELKDFSFKDAFLTFITNFGGGLFLLLVALILATYSWRLLMRVLCSLMGINVPVADSSHPLAWYWRWLGHLLKLLEKFHGQPARVKMLLRISIVLLALGCLLCIFWRLYHEFYAG